MQGMSKAVIAILLLTAALAGPAQVLGAQAQPDMEVTARGEGLSPKAALLAAKRAAVEEAAGVMIISESEVRNFALHKDKIISRTMGSVKKYTLLSEKDLGGGMHESVIRALISLEQINQDLEALSILFESMDKPRVMVIIDEKIGGKRTFNAQTAINRQLVEYGFNMVDPATVAALFGDQKDLVSRAAGGDVAAASEIGVKNGAEVILVGTAHFSRGGDVYRMKSGQADVSVSAVLCQTGQIVAAESAHDAEIHANYEAAWAKAAKNAAAKIVQPKDKKNTKSVPTLFDKLVLAWQDMANNGRTIRLTAGNVSSFQAFKAMKNMVENLDSDVVSVVQRGWDKPRMEMEVVFKGSSESLAMLLDGQKLSNVGVLEVQGLEPGSLEVSIVK